MKIWEQVGKGECYYGERRALLFRRLLLGGNVSSCPSRTVGPVTSRLRQPVPECISAQGDRGPVGKTTVVAVKDRPSKRVRAKVVEDTTVETLQGFVLDTIQPGGKVSTDEARSYDALPNREAVAHSLHEYVRGTVHTNGIESYWSMLKRAHMGTFHRPSPRHLHRYVSEFVARHNLRGLDTLDQVVAVFRLMDGHRLRYRELVG